ncbi:MAG TPA: MCE family protein [Aeromicrobium sp.]|nr:MCE family protein [Aeromicrobium sp.]
MLVNIFHDSKSEHRRLMLAGFAFLAAIAALVWLSIALYNKTFTSTTTVTVQAERAGLQLSKFGDVRMHGALVGYVDSVKSDGEHAVVTLALRPDAAERIPENVDVRILPTTLFGQKFVELVPPAQGASAKGLTDGTVIGADRVSTNEELQTVLADLYPVLRSVDPAKLNAALTALSGALDGKGDQLGATLADLDAYLGRFNQDLPTLQTDLQLLAEVARTYQLAAPDLLDVMKSASVTTRTISSNKANIVDVFGSLTNLARTARVTLADNEQLLIDQVQSGRPLLSLLDRYSPEFNCLLTGLDRQIPNSKAVFSDAIIRQTMELGSPQRLPYTEEDAPVYGEVGHGPWCLGLPDDYENPAPFLPLKDGSDRDEPDGGLG